jgi:bifunctional DNA-binding transcriptional regulator/antitoxin component of YhaV-PrlF toxin-antitoxin module
MTKDSAKTQAVGSRKLKRIGGASLPPNGQITIPIDLRRDWGIENVSTPMEIYSDRVGRRIVLVEVIDDPEIDHEMYEARVDANARRQAQQERRKDT